MHGAGGVHGSIHSSSSLLTPPSGSGIISMAEFVAFAKANEEQMPVFRQAFFRQGSAPAQQQQQQPEKEAKKRV